MNPQSLHALIVDRHAGELSPEAVELLELHLAQNPEARTEAERILQALDVTRDAVVQHPELARLAPQARPAIAEPQMRRRSTLPWLAWAAAMVVLATLAGAGGFVAGRSQSQAQTEAVRQPSKPVIAVVQAQPRKQSPWAQYRMTFHPGGEGMQVVRVDGATARE